MRAESRVRLMLCRLLPRLIRARRVYVQFIEADGRILTAEATSQQYSAGGILTIVSDRRDLLRDDH